MWNIEVSGNFMYSQEWEENKSSYITMGKVSEKSGPINSTGYYLATRKDKV